MKRLAVTIIGPSLRYVGGQSVQADLLRRHWKDDPEIAVNFVPIDPDLPRLLSWVLKIPYLRTLARAPRFLNEVWQGIAETDIVHIFSASYWSFLLAPAPAWLVARMRGKTILINYHSGEAPDHLRRSPIARIVLRRADQIVVPSQYLVDVFREYGVAARVVPNLVDFRQMTYRPRIPLRPRLICSRMFEPYYQVDLVVRAFAEVQKAFPEAHLCLVGSGSLEKMIRALVSELGLRNVEFAGAIERQQIGRYYDTADIFVNASRLDNMPVSTLEAFACGTPVVSTAPDGMRYLVEHERTGLLCEPGDWRALAGNIVRLLQDPQLALRLSQDAYSESRKYRWDAVRGQWLEIYHFMRSRWKARENIGGLDEPEMISTSKE